MLYLDTSSLSEVDSLCWQFFLHFIVKHTAFDQQVEIGEGLVPSDRNEFVFVSSSQALSRRLLTNYSYIYLAPQHPPRFVESYLYRQLRAAENADTLDSTAEEIKAWLRTMVPAVPRAALISSVFSADTYLAGFLENMAALDGYDGDEHFLIRPGSPGNEHRPLVEHVRQHPGAVYINLQHDPGLYQVWNLGTRLATAAYLSNANLDDRRAPDHVARLCDCLNSHPDVAVVSSRLRATDRPNLPWEQSTYCPTMFGNVPGGRYAAQDLVRQTDQGAVSRNLPHCMPVWRRQLHADYGEFDEKNFGPSADWEFWLRTAVRGETFYFLPEALGLYLQTPGSYWHRQDNSQQNRFDQRILERYEGFIAQGDSIAHQPLALDIILVQRLFKAQNYGGGLCWLLRSIKRGWSLGQSTQKILGTLCRKFLGCDNLEGVSSLFEWDGKSIGLFSVVLELGHRIGRSLEKRGYRTLDLACFDWYEMTGERQWLLLRALLARWAGQDSLEAVLLKGLFEEDPIWFWENLQSVYRFTVPLKTLVALLRCMRVADEADRQSVSNLRLVFFPDYRSSNDYTDLLYHSVSERGGQVEAATTIADLEALSILPGRENVVHLHWIQAVFKGCRADCQSGQAGSFLELLNKLQNKGFKIYWTVHNRLSHDGQNPGFEVEFRKRLAAQVDRIYLHHPLAIALLDWLDCRDKVYLVEHGSYARPAFVDDEPQLSRRMMGVKPQGLVVCHLGLIRDYKGLEDTLPVMLECLQAETDAQFVIAGRIVGTSLQKWLQKHKGPGLQIKGERLNEEELERYMHVSDFGFLSYRDILTSGSLFHWFSCGRPVIAPAKGTIPAYVVDGWNGFLYSDEQELRDVIRRAASLTAAQRQQLGANALTVANTLKWQLF